MATAGAGCDATAADVQAALDAAKTSSANDEIVIGPGRFEGPFSYMPFTDAGTLKIVHVPANTTNQINPGNIGIRAAGAVDRVHVVFDANDASATAPAGVVLSTSGAAVRDSDIELPATNNFGTGVQAQGLNLAFAPLVADSRIVAPTGVAAAPEALTVVRSRIVSSMRGVEACDGPVTIEDSLIQVTESFGVGLEPVAGRCGFTQPSITARQVTIVGNDAVGQAGVLVRIGVSGRTAVVDVSLSILRNLATLR